jgi:hypothetical protein
MTLTDLSLRLFFRANSGDRKVAAWKNHQLRLWLQHQQRQIRHHQRQFLMMPQMLNVAWTEFEEMPSAAMRLPLASLGVKEQCHQQQQFFVVGEC